MLSKQVCKHAQSTSPNKSESTLLRTSAQPAQHTAFQERTIVQLPAFPVRLRQVWEALQRRSRLAKGQGTLRGLCFRAEALSLHGGR